MKTTIIRLSSATVPDLGLRSILSAVEACEGIWDVGNVGAHTYVTTIEYQLSGIVRRTICGRTYITKANCLSVFANNTQIEEEEIRPHEASRVLFLRLTGDLAKVLEKSLKVRPDKPFRLNKAPTNVCQAVRDAAHLIYDRPHNWPMRLCSKLLEMIFNIHDTKYLSKPHDSLTDQACSLVAANPHHLWTVNELAEKIGVRREILWHNFKKQMGQTPGKWLEEQKIKIAQCLIERGFTVQDTADRLGYSSRQQFGRFYNRMLGKPATQHRRKKKNTEQKN